jgi:transposase-like protein
MDRKDQAKALFLNGETIQAIADRFDISRRTVERWADAGNWREEKEQQSNVVPLAKPKQPKLATHPPVRVPLRRSEGLDDLEVIEGAIAELAAALPDADDKSKGGIANALRGLVEYKRKLRPPTATELAQQVIELGISPTEFVRELKEKWQHRA